MEVFRSSGPNSKTRGGRGRRVRGGIPAAFRLGVPTSEAAGLAQGSGTLSCCSLSM